jgi:hypothetical protein
VSPSERSQHSVDFSHLGDSWDKSTGAQHYNSRSSELREVRREGQPSLTFKSRRFARKEHGDSTLRLAKSRRELAFSLAGDHAQRVLTEGSHTHFVISGIARFGRKSLRFRLANSRDCELRQAPLGLGLGHSAVVAR